MRLAQARPPARRRATTATTAPPQARAQARRQTRRWAPPRAPPRMPAPAPAQPWPLRPLPPSMPPRRQRRGLTRMTTAARMTAARLLAHMRPRTNALQSAPSGNAGGEIATRRDASYVIVCRVPCHMWLTRFLPFLVDPFSDRFVA